MHLTPSLSPLNSFGHSTAPISLQRVMTMVLLSFVLRPCMYTDGQEASREVGSMYKDGHAVALGRVWGRETISARLAEG